MFISKHINFYLQYNHTMVKKRRLIQQRLNAHFREIQANIDAKVTKREQKSAQKRGREDEVNMYDAYAMQVDSNQSAPNAKRGKKSKREKKVRRRLEKMAAWKKQNFENRENIAINTINKLNLGMSIPPVSEGEVQKLKRFKKG